MQPRLLPRRAAPIQAEEIEYKSRLFCNCILVSSTARTPSALHFLLPFALGCGHYPYNFPLFVPFTWLLFLISKFRPFNRAGIGSLMITDAVLHREELFGEWTDRSICIWKWPLRRARRRRHCHWVSRRKLTKLDSCWKSPEAGMMAWPTKATWTGREARQDPHRQPTQAKDTVAF